MKMWMESGKARCKAAVTRRLAVALIAVVAVGSVATFNFTKTAKAAVAAPAAAALDDNSVGALLTLDRAMETLAARVTPAVVNVTVVSKSNAQPSGPEGMPDMQQFFGPGSPFGRQFGRQFNVPSQPQNPMEHGLGSGVIISPDGYIVTNNHVIDGAVDIRVTMSNREVLPAKLVGADPLTDLAVIKVNATNLPSVPWGNSADLHPGRPHERLRMTRSQCGSLNLHCMKLSFTTPRRFLPAHKEKQDDREHEERNQRHSPRGERHREREGGPGHKQSQPDCKRPE